jgi:hypothetical protein
MFESQRDDIYFKGGFYILALWDSTIFGDLNNHFTNISSLWDLQFFLFIQNKKM